MPDFYFFSYQQWRLIPKLAATYALAYFARTFFLNFVEMEIGIMMGEKGEAQVRKDKIYEDFIIIIVILLTINNTYS